MSCYQIAAVYSIQTHFHRGRSIAQGIGLSAMSFGTLAWAPSVDLLFESWSWRQAFIAVGLMQLFCIPLSLMLPARESSTPSTSSSSDVTNRENTDDNKNLPDLLRHSVTASPVMEQNNDGPANYIQTGRSFSRASSVVSMSSDPGNEEPANYEQTSRFFRRSSSVFSISSDPGFLARPRIRRQSSIVSLFRNDMLIRPPRAIFARVKPVVRDKAFIILCTGYFFNAFGHMLPFLWLPTLGKNLGLELKESAYLISILGKTNSFH